MEIVKVDLWYVVGLSGIYYGSKYLAEDAAAKTFPEENAAKRYNRLGVMTFYQDA